MNELAALSTQQMIDIKKSDTPTLKRMLADQLTLTAKTLEYLAQIWQELALRGVDLSDLRTGLATYLPRIAAGTLDARLVVNYAGKTRLIEALAKLTVTEQAEYIESGKAVVVKLDKDLNRVDEQVPLTSLSAIKVGRLFRNGRIISPSEQYQSLFLTATRTEKERQRQKRNASYQFARVVKIDGEDIIVGTSKTTLKRIYAELSAIHGFDVESLLAEQSLAQR